MPVLSLACHLPHNTPHIPSHYNNEQTTKQTKAINNSYIYINISCKYDTNRAGHFTLDAYASRPVACPKMCWKASRTAWWMTRTQWKYVPDALMEDNLWRHDVSIKRSIEYSFHKTTQTWYYSYQQNTIIIGEEKNFNVRYKGCRGPVLTC